MSYKIDSDDVVSIYDGDTFKIKIRMDPPFFDEIAVRIAGIDTPEIKGKSKFERDLAEEAKEFLAKALKKSSSIRLENVKPDKYFRVGAHVLIDRKPIGEIMIDQGLARVYDGGKRKPWKRFARRRASRVNRSRVFFWIVLGVGAVWAAYLLANNG